MMIRNMAIMAGLSVTLLLVAGCSGGGDSWYSETSRGTQEKEDFIRTQSAMGMDPEEARRQYEINQIIRNTEGRHEQTF